MANDPGPCGPQFEDWEDEFSDWQKADAAADDAIEDAAWASSVAAAVCGASWWTGVGLIGCAAATANALYADKESIQASRSRNDAFDELQKDKKAYEECVNNHKKYYGVSP